MDQTRTLTSQEAEGRLSKLIESVGHGAVMIENYSVQKTDMRVEHTFTVLSAIHWSHLNGTKFINNTWTFDPMRSDFVDEAHSLLSEIKQGRISIREGIIDVDDKGQHFKIIVTDAAGAGYSSYAMGKDPRS